ADEKPSDSCRFMVVWHALRLQRMGSNKTPPAFAEMLADFALDPSAQWLVRKFAAENLTYFDLQLADRTWRALLNDPKLPDDMRPAAYMHLARIASRTKNWAEGLRWIDRYDAF